MRRKAGIHFIGRVRASSSANLPKNISMIQGMQQLLLPRFFIVILLIWCSCVDAVNNPEEYVHPLSGTFTDGDRFSTGNTLPLVALPWGFNHWAPMTRDGNRHTGSWWFKGNDHQLTWLRCTHQPSPWIGDWGWFIFMPMLENVDRNPTYYWEPRGATIKPYVFDATVAPHTLRIQLSPTNHGAVLKITYPDYIQASHVHMCFAEADIHEIGSLSSSKNGKAIYGKSTKVSIDRMPVTNFGMHFVAMSKDATAVNHRDDMTCFEYDYNSLRSKKEPFTVSIHMATSLISEDQAKRNYQEEVDADKLTFEDVYNNAKKIWNSMLSRVEIVEQPPSDAFSRHLEIFYTGLYRALLFPRRLDEVDGSGRVVHYSPYSSSGGVHDGPLCTDNGFWDTFRTVYPLMSLLYPEQLGEIVQGWLNAYREGGWLPSWASPGYRNCMAGTYADVVVADAIIKEIPGFDLRLAKDAIIKDSFENPPRFGGGAVGKDGLDAYREHGHLPGNFPGTDQVSRSLDFGYADHAVAKALEYMASTSTSYSKNAGFSDEEKSRMKEQSRELSERSLKPLKTLFDSSTGLMVLHDNNRHFRDIQWGNGYIEGNAWHHSFPPYNVPVLAELHGGKAALAKRLNQLIHMSSNFEPGSYNQEIHEMTEARVVALGQYAHNNQPSHHLLFLFSLLDQPDKTFAYTRHVIEHAYGEDFFSGDEDNGEQGSWYVMAALGLFAEAPGNPHYVITSPLFKKVRILKPRPGSIITDKKNGRMYEKLDVARGRLVSIEQDQDLAYLELIAPETDINQIQVKKVLVNGNVIDKWTIEDSSIRNGAKVEFVYSDSNNGKSSSSSATATTTTVTNSNTNSNSNSNSNGNGNGNSNNLETVKLNKLLRERDSKIALLEAQLKSFLTADNGNSQGGNKNILSMIENLSSLKSQPRNKNNKYSAIDDDLVQEQQRLADKPSIELYLMLLVLLAMGAYLGARLIEVLNNANQFQQSGNGATGSNSKKKGLAGLGWDDVYHIGGSNKHPARVV